MGLSRGLAGCAIVKKELQFDASLYTLLQIFSVPLFKKIQISCALQPIDPSRIELPPLINWYRLAYPVCQLRHVTDISDRARARCQ